MRRRSCLSSALVLIAGWAVPLPTVCANPSAQDPTATLAIHNLSGSQETLDRAKAVYQKAAENLGLIAKGGAKAPFKLIGQTHILVSQLDRLAKDLNLLAEPAGVDLQFRCEILRSQMSTAINAASGPAAAAEINKIRVLLQNPANAQKRSLTLRQIQQFNAQQKWIEAYNLATEAFDALQSWTIFLPPNESSSYDAPFVEPLLTATSGRSNLLRFEAQAKVKAAGDNLVRDNQAFLDALANATAGLRTAPTATLGGSARTGPQCLDFFLQQWKAWHAAALRLQALEDARRIVLAGLSNPNVPPFSPRIVPAAYDQFCDGLLAGLIALVEADATRATDQEARTLYTQYLQVLAPVLSRTSDERLATGIQAPLEKLAAKSPELKAEVMGYRIATGELLRWRQRVAATAAQTLTSKYKTSQSLLVSATTSNSQYRGLIPESRPDLAEARLGGTCPEILQGAAPRVIQQPILLQRLFSIAGGRYAVSQFALRHYGNTSIAQPAAEIDRLKQDLLVADGSTTLSLEAAVAIASAELGDYEAVGGTVQNMVLEGLVSRFAVLPEAAVPLVPLGRLPVSPQLITLNDVLVRLEVKPDWVQHRYFFLPLAAPSEPPASAPNQLPAPSPAPDTATSAG